MYIDSREIEYEVVIGHDLVCALWFMCIHVVFWLFLLSYLAGLLVKQHRYVYFVHFSSYNPGFSPL